MTDERGETTSLGDLTLTEILEQIDALCVRSVDELTDGERAA